MDWSEPLRLDTLSLNTPGIPIRGNIFLSLETLFSDSFLPLLRISFFGIELSKQYDIEFYIRYGLIFAVLFFYYIKVRTEDTGNCSHPHSYRWGVLTRLTTFIHRTALNKAVYSLLHL